MENKRVIIESLVDGKVVMNLPEMHLHIVWERKGAKKPIEFEKLQEAIYDQGVEYMFKQGILYIDDMEVKKALYLEPDDAEEPQNIKIMDEKLMKRLLTVASIVDLQAALKEYPHEQVDALVDYAIKTECGDFDRCDLIKKHTGRDIIKAIQLSRQNKED